MAQDYIHPLQALRAELVQRRRKLAESLLGSRKGAKAARRRKKLIKLQGEIDVIDDAIADEQLLSPSLREQLAKERTPDKPTEDDGEVAEPIGVTPYGRSRASSTSISGEIEAGTRRLMAQSQGNKDATDSVGKLKMRPTLWVTLMYLALMPWAQAATFDCDKASN